MREFSQEILILGTHATRWRAMDWRELLSHRELFFGLVRRDFLYKYTQTLFGPLWFLLQPLFMTLTFSVVFGRVAKISTEGIPPVLFYLTGLIVWGYFIQSYESVGECLRSHASLMGKVYFPRLLLPLAVVVSRLFTVLIQSAFLVLLYGGMALYGGAAGIGPTSHLLAAPFFLVQISLLSLGMGLCSAVLTVRYRDFHNLTAFFIPLWMYVTPIIYPASSLPESCRWWFFLNPLAPSVEWFRMALYGRGFVDFRAIAFSLVATLVILAIGLISFRGIEPTFLDTI